MKKFILILFVIAITMESCNNGHKSQNWHPRSGKKMKAGHNNK